MTLSKQQQEKMMNAYKRSKEFVGYSQEEIFQLGMEEAMKIAGIIIPEIELLKKRRELGDMMNVQGVIGLHSDS